MKVLWWVALLAVRAVVIIIGFALIFVFSRWCAQILGLY
jgi:hypothetical protein